MVKFCCVRGCGSKLFRNCPWSFHQFPKSELRTEWIRSIGVDKTYSKDAVVCSRHFKKEDFYPTHASSKAMLRECAVPSLFGSKARDSSRKVKIMKDEDDENSMKRLFDTIIETKLPDGTVCEFYSSDVDDEIASNSDDEEITIEDLKITPAKVSEDVDVMVEHFKTSDRPSLKRKASNDSKAGRAKSPKKMAGVSLNEPQNDVSQKEGIEFDQLLHALEQNQIKLPSILWSYTRLGQTLLIFLCWSNELKLIKKAVFCQSQLCLFIGDQLFAEGTIQGRVDLEECLRRLDMVELCKGIAGTNNSWSKNCAKYTASANDKESCAACLAAADAVRNTNRNTEVPLLTGTLMVGVPESAPCNTPQGLDVLMNSNPLTLQTKNVVGVQPLAIPEVPSSNYLVVDFVVPTEGLDPSKPTGPSVTLETQQNILKGSVTKTPLGNNSKPKTILINRPPVSPFDNLKSQKVKIESMRSQTKKIPTARKSTGGPPVNRKSRRKKDNAEISKKTVLASYDLSTPIGSPQAIEDDLETTKVVTYSAQVSGEDEYQLEGYTTRGTRPSEAKSSALLSNEDHHNRKVLEDFWTSATISHSPQASEGTPEDSKTSIKKCYSPENSDEIVYLDSDMKSGD